MSSVPLGRTTNIQGAHDTSGVNGLLSILYESESGQRQYLP